MPVARGWGSGGLQVTLALAGPGDVVKVIDQGDDGGVNAANLRRLIAQACGCERTTATDEATIIQTRHRIPELPLRPDQILVLQVPVPEPLRAVERGTLEQRRMHAEGDYAAIWISLYEDIVRHGVITATTGYPALVGGRYVIATTPIPRWDVPKLDQAPYLSIFGAGREKRIYAIPPHTNVKPLTFEDVPFEVEVTDAFCVLCDADGRIDSFLVEVPGDPPRFVCSDAAWCAARSGRTSDEEL
jgi:alpha-D-ribose 1-methylphosphonate 5-phosphate C-P lyase